MHETYRVFKRQDRLTQTHFTTLPEEGHAGLEETELCLGLALVRNYASLRQRTI